MWYNWNGDLVEELSLSKDNRSFRYGDGLFESMRVFKSLTDEDLEAIEKRMKTVCR